MGITATVLGAAAGQSIGRRTGKLIAKSTGASKKTTQSYKNLAGALGTAYGAAGANFIPILGAFKEGGEVKKTGAYILHKGEEVIPAEKVKEKAKKAEARVQKISNSADKKAIRISNTANKANAKAAKLNEKANRLKEKKDRIMAEISTK